MIASLFAFFRLHWAWLRYVLLVLSVLLAVPTLVQSSSYLLAALHRRRLRTEQAQATGAHAQQRASAAARYQRYQVDSTRLVTQKQFLRDGLTILEQQDAKLDSLRPARVRLPAYEQLPRE